MIGRTKGLKTKKITSSLDIENLVNVFLEKNKDIDVIQITYAVSGAYDKVFIVYREFNSN